MKDNIVLIGMPGVGKSTVGVVLAKALGYNFVDADLVIQQQTGKLLCELIAEHGTEGFLEIEDEVNSSIEGHKAVQYIVQMPWSIIKKLQPYFI